MSVREYVGARYVPVFATPIDWNSANTYEPLTIVLHEGNSYTSRQAVPAGVQITNTAYWAQTGNYNAQIEQYRQDVAALANRFPVSVLDGGTGGTDAATARTNLDAAQADGATNTLYDAEQAIAANAADIISLQDSVAYSSEQITLSGISSGTVTAMRFGRVVSVMFENVDLANPLSVGNNVVVGTIPAKYRPQTTVFVPCITAHPDSMSKIRVAIFPNGDVDFRNRSSETIIQGHSPSCLLTYIAAS